MVPYNPLRMEVYFCHQNQNTKNIVNFTTRLTPHNIGTHLKGIETSFQVVSLFLKSFHFWGELYHFLKFMMKVIYDERFDTFVGIATMMNEFVADNS
jgi:hypothetical protein